MSFLKGASKADRRLQDATRDTSYSMSDSLEPTRPMPPSPSKSDETSPSSTEKSSRKPLFGSLNRDLKQALDTWEELTEQMNQKMSPEEEQMREVKRLLGELKSKLSQFED